jgi:tetratricopeptide (TPR) repeat protein
LAGRDGELPVRLGDLYDELAEMAAQDGDYELAARVETKAVEAGCGQPFVAREMRGWYLLKAGATDEGEAAFRELCAERPHDAGLRITLGHARSDAGLQERALDAFDDALAAAKRRGFQKDIDRARIERRAEREHVGLQLDEDDRLAPVPLPRRSGAIAWSMPFPPGQRQAALELWPDLAEDFADPRAYAQRLEHQLRDLDRALGCRPTLAPIDVVT